MIDDPRSSRVRSIAQLSQKRARFETGLFLVEGPQAVQEALLHKPGLIVELFVTPSAHERYRDIFVAAEREQVEHTFVSERVLDALADTVTPQGVLAVCRQFPTALKDIFSQQPRLIVVLEEVRDPGNAGTIIRVADAVGADAVIFTGRSVDLYNPKVVRSTTGSLFHLPTAVEATLSDVRSRVSAAGLQMLAADVSGESVLGLRSAGVLERATAWLFGNEARGLSDEDIALADCVVSVPIYGKAESMNLATAASVCLYETAFAQRAGSR